MLRATKRLISASGRRTQRLIFRHAEYRVYRIDLAALAVASPIDVEFARNNITDLEKFQAIERWQNKTASLSGWRERLRAGSTVYTRSDGATLLHYGWLTSPIRHSFFTEVQQQFRYPNGSVGLWDFYTHPPARGRGLYQASLATMLNDAVKDASHEFAYIGVLANNLPSRHVIEKRGFEYRGSLFRRQILGAAYAWSTFPCADTEWNRINDREFCCRTRASS